MTVHLPGSIVVTSGQGWRVARELSSWADLEADCAQTAVSGWGAGGGWSQGTRCPRLLPERSAKSLLPVPQHVLLPSMRKPV